jgi:hypothetical protein
MEDKNQTPKDTEKAGETPAKPSKVHRDGWGNRVPDISDEMAYDRHVRNLHDDDYANRGLGSPLTYRRR